MDKLSIVNHMLFTIGEQVVSTLATGHPSVIQALTVLEGADLDFQGRGWWFNTENGITLAQDDLGKVTIPTGTLSLQVVSCIASGSTPNENNRARYTVRGNKVYDSFDHTFVLNSDLRVNVVVRQEIEDLPHIAGTYLKHLAGETMYIADDGDEQKLRRLQDRTMLAWHSLKAEELKNANVNALASPSASQLRYRINQAGSPSNAMYPGGR